MDNILRHVTADDVAFFVENQYSKENKEKFLKVFEAMRRDGHIKNQFNEDKWMCYSGVKQFGINFMFPVEEYERHIGREFGITANTMKEMLKCYSVFNVSVYIFANIADRVNVLKKFVCSYGEQFYRVCEDEVHIIQDFLDFVGTPEKQIDSILNGIHLEKAACPKQRELKHLINYLAVDAEITDLYHSEISQEEFIRWFPIYFWTKITFIIPLRATEMLLTPLHCLERKRGEVWLSLRRTQLKKGKKKVHYEVEKDYKTFEYKIPESEVIETIERYQELTKDRERKYLFVHNVYAINHMLSLQTFNMLLADFVKTYLIGNAKYDYARFACGITEFQLPTAGDSRPIAMANLYYQDVAADICRQLADHTHINTSAGYYTNVSNTVLASSIMQLQRKLNSGYIEVNALSKQQYQIVSVSVCTSPYRPKETGNIQDCIKEKHLQECLGCRYYSPSAQELECAIKERKAALNAASRRVLECMADKKKVQELDKAILEAHTGIVRLKEAGDIKATEEARKWERHRNTQTISS